MNDNLPAPQFFDTNILVYAYDLSAGRKRGLAKTIVEQCWKDQNGCLSIQVLQEFYVTLTQKITPPLDRQSARQIVADLSYWKTHTPEADDILQAIDLQGEYSLSFWDAMIVQSALRLGCGQIWSEDMSAGQAYHGVTVINPFLE